MGGASRTWDVDPLVGARTRADFVDWQGSGPLAPPGTTGTAVDVPSSEWSLTDAVLGKLADLGEWLGGTGKVIVEDQRTGEAVVTSESRPGVVDAALGVPASMASALHGVLVKDVLLVVLLAGGLLLVAGKALPPVLRELR